MTMLSLSRRLGITPRPDRDEYDPAAAGWLDSVRPEDPHEGAVQRAFVPQQWAGTSAVRDREHANYAADDHEAGDRSATARGPHPLGLAEPAAAPAWEPEPPFTGEPSETQPIDRLTASARPDTAWPEICDQFGSHLLVLAEQLRSSLNVLEAGEDDPDRLKRLYQVDHAVTRMRLASRQLRTLAGRDEERQAGFTTSLVDVIRMASSAIEWYPQVSIGPVAELAVLGYAADDVATLMSALLDNATRYSPGMVGVSCHLLEDGGVMFRIADTGIGIARDQVARLNAAFAGPVPDVNESTARHTGFPVVHRLARKHSIGVRFASRRRPGTGTLAMVTLPPQLLCAITATTRRAHCRRRAVIALARRDRGRTPRRELADLMETASAGESPRHLSQVPPTQAAPTQAPPPMAALLEAAPPVAELPEGRRRWTLPEAAADGALPAAPRRRADRVASPAVAPTEVASPTSRRPSHVGGSRPGRAAGGGVDGAGPDRRRVTASYRAGNGRVRAATSRGRPRPSRHRSRSRRRPGGPSPTTSARSPRASRTPSPRVASPAASSARRSTEPHRGRRAVMNNPTELPPSEPQDFGWLVDNFALSTPGVTHALIVSSDGLPLITSTGLAPDLADPLAAMTSGIISIGNNIASQIGEPGCEQVMLKFPSGHFLFMGIGSLAGFAVLVEEGANLGAVGHQMARLVDSVGHLLTPQLRDDLRRMSSPVTEGAGRDR